MAKAGLPQGTRDFNAAAVRKRQYIFGVIRETFERYGFEPLETPALENLDTLMGKYGEEGDRLIFKILNNGLDNPAKRDQLLADFGQVLAGKLSRNLTERALRYDLTIPFARYVAMNRNELALPFKRYQIQPVWRADRPQKGRYREFWQCDADVVGSSSLLNEVELAQIYLTVFRRLGVPVEVKINHRKILSALAARVGGSSLLTDITVAIDKLDKIGGAGVQNELRDRGLAPDQIGAIGEFLAIGGDNAERIARLKEFLADQPDGLAGVADLETVLGYFDGAGPQIDTTLARGLNYYTGTIFEVKPVGVAMGSLGGGGRYDDLTSLFGVPAMAGVGISFGVDRIYDVMDELGLFPETIAAGTRVLFFCLGDRESRRAFELVQSLRDRGVAAELYPEAAKFDRQFKYAEKKNIPYVAILGSEELASGEVKLKDLRSGAQESVRMTDLLTRSF